MPSGCGCFFRNFISHSQHPVHFALHEIVKPRAELLLSLLAVAPLPVKHLLRHRRDAYAFPVLFAGVGLCSARRPDVATLFRKSFSHGKRPRAEQSPAPTAFFDKLRGAEAPLCVLKNHIFAPLWMCMGGHWPPADLAQQRIFREGFFHRQTGTGEQCSPLQAFFDAASSVSVTPSHRRRSSCRRSRWRRPCICGRCRHAPA